MVTINYFPFGKARELENYGWWFFECQHGKLECDYNIVETCGFHFISDPYKQFEFLNCIENNNHNQKYEHTINKCQKQTGIDEDVAS